MHPALVAAAFLNGQLVRLFDAALAFLWQFDSH
jgi:hypothetical protein